MPVDESLAFATVETLGQKLRRKEVTSVELSKFFLDRCERLGPKLNAVVTVTRKVAMEQAAKADKELSAGYDRGPLHGIPFGVKDLLATKDIATSWGAAPYKDQIPDGDATVIVRLREAGAVLVAKLAMVEIAGGFGYRQANASFSGPGLNPWDRTRWSGGSSSGSGSAVGGGLVPFAIGSETWGSIVTPAGYCGLTGLRPTYGRVSRHGAMALSWTMDKLGPMCHSAHDCGLVLQAIAGFDPADDTSIVRPYEYPTRQLLEPPFKFASLKGGTKNVQKEVRQNYKEMLKVLQDFGTVEEIDLPNQPYNVVAGTLVSCEMAAAFQGMVRSGDCWELTAEEDRWGGHSALMIPAVDYINATRIRRQMQKSLDDVLSKYDAVIAPNLSTVAPPIDRPFHEYVKGFASTSIGGAGNVTGVPAITMPIGFGEKHLPTAAQLMGRAFEENRLLKIASLYQSKTDWHRQHPGKVKTEETIPSAEK